MNSTPATDKESADTAAAAQTAPAKPELNLDPQTEELFRFIDSLKKLKESEDLEKAGGQAVVQASSSGNLTTIAFFVVILGFLAVVAYGAYVWMASRDHTITDPQIIMTNAREAFKEKRYDETIFWAQQIMVREKDSKSLVPEAVLMLVKSHMAMDHIRDAAQVADHGSSKFESDVSAEMRGEFHHLEGVLFKRLERMNPGQKFLEAYKADPKNFKRLKDKFFYIQCLLNEPNVELTAQLKLLGELEQEINDNTSVSDKDKSELRDQVKDWRKTLEQLKG